LSLKLHEIRLDFQGAAPAALRFDAARARNGAVWAILCAALFSIAVEAQEGRPAGQTSAASGAFEPPVVDLVATSDAVRAEIDTAIAEIRAKPNDAVAVGRLGMLYHGASQPLAAKSCFQRAAALAPDSFRWWYYLGLSAAESYETQEAIDALAHAAKIDANYGPVFVERGQLLVRSDPAAAAKLFQRALEISPNDARAAFGLGQCAREEGKPDEAERRFREALTLAPNYKAAHSALAELLGAAGKDQEADVHRSQAAVGGEAPFVNDPLLVELVGEATGGEQLLSLVERMARGGQVDEAIALLQGALEKDDSEIGVRHALGVLLRVRGLLRDAVAEFRQILQKDPYQYKTVIELARTLIRLRNYEEAEELLREVISSGSGNPSAIGQYGELLLKMGRSDEARRYYEQLLEAQPLVPRNHMGAARSWVCLDKPRQAASAYRKATELSSETEISARALVLSLIRLMVDQRTPTADGKTAPNPLAPHQLRSLAASFEAMGLSEEARTVNDWLDVAIAMAGRLASRGLYTRAMPYLKLGLEDGGDEGRAEVVRRLEGIVKKAPDEPRVRHLYALLLDETGAAQDAWEQWRGICEAHPDFSSARLMWSVSLIGRGRHGEAREILEKGIEARPDDPLLANALAWSLATAPKATAQDGARAVTLATGACDILQRGDPKMLDTLAAAHATAGAFDQAEAVVREAINLANKLGQNADAASFRPRLLLYQAGERYVETAASTQPKPKSGD